MVDINEYQSQALMIQQLKDLIRQKDLEVELKNNCLKESEAKLSKSKLQLKAKEAKISKMKRSFENRKTEGTSQHTTTLQETKNASDIQNSKNKLLFQQKNIEEKEKTLEKKRLALKEQERKFEHLKEEFNLRYNDLNQHVQQVSNNQGIDIASLAENSPFVKELYSAILSKDQRIAELMSTVDNSNSNIQNINKQLQKYKQERQHLIEAEQSQQNLIGHLEKRLTEQEDKIKCMVEEFESESITSSAVDDLNRQVEKLESKLRDKEETVALKEEQILQIKREQDTNWEDLQESSLQNDQLIKSLKRKLHEQEEVLSGREKVVLLLQSELTDRNDEIQGMQSTIRILQESLRENLTLPTYNEMPEINENINSKDTSCSDTSKREIDQLQVEKDLQIAENAALREEIEILSNKNQFAWRQIENLKLEVEDVRLKLHENNHNKLIEGSNSQQVDVYSQTSSLYVSDEQKFKIRLQTIIDQLNHQTKVLESQTEELRKSEETNEKLQIYFDASQHDLEDNRREISQIKNGIRTLLSTQQTFNKTFHSANNNLLEEGNEFGDNRTKLPHKLPLFSPDRDESALELVEILRAQLDMNSELMTSLVEQKQDLVTSFNQKSEAKSKEDKDRELIYDKLKTKFEQMVIDYDEAKTKLAASEANCDEITWKLNEMVAKHEEELEKCRKEAESKINGACDELKCVRDKIETEKEDAVHRLEEFRELSLKAKSELKEVSDENKRLERLNEKNNKEIERLTESLQTADAKLKDACKKRGKSDKIVDELKSHLAVSTAEIASLQNKVQQKIQAFSMIENENVRLRDKLASLSKEDDSFYDCQRNVKEKLKRADEIQNQFDQHHSEVECKLLETENKLKESMEKVQDNINANNSNCELEMFSDNSFLDGDARQQTIEYLQSQLEELAHEQENQLAENMKLVGRLNMDIQRLNEEKSDIYASYEKQSSNLCSVTKRLEDKQEDCARLHHQVTELQRKLSQARSSRQQNYQLSEEFTGRLRSAEDKITSFETKLQESMNELAFANDEKLKYQQKIPHLNKKLEKAKNESNNLSDELDRCKQLVVKLQSELDAVEQNNEILARQHLQETKQLKSILRERDNDLTTLRDDLRDKDAMVNSLTSNYEEKEQALQNHQATLNERNNKDEQQDMFRVRQFRIKSKVVEQMIEQEKCRQQTVRRRKSITNKK